MKIKSDNEDRRYKVSKKELRSFRLALVVESQCSVVRSWCYGFGLHKTTLTPYRGSNVEGKVLIDGLYTTVYNNKHVTLAMN